MKNLLDSSHKISYNDYKNFFRGSTGIKCKRDKRQI